MDPTPEQVSAARAQLHNALRGQAWLISIGTGRDRAGKLELVVTVDRGSLRAARALTSPMRLVMPVRVREGVRPRVPPPRPSPISPSEFERLRAIAERRGRPR